MRTCNHALIWLNENNISHVYSVAHFHFDFNIIKSNTQFSYSIQQHIYLFFHLSTPPSTHVYLHKTKFDVEKNITMCLKSF